MRLSVVTPTCGRPEAMRLCRMWQERQTVEPHEWLIVEEFVREPGWRNYCANLRSAVERAAGDAIVIVEDDDWYAPRYLELVAAWLGDFDVIGNQHTRYYDLRRRSWLSVRKHISPLSQTAFRIEHRDLFLEVLSGVSHIDKPYVDRDTTETVDSGFWSAVRQRAIPFAAPMAPYRWLGIKGMPGSGQISAVRDREAHQWSRDDAGLTQLHTYLKDDAVHYLPFVAAEAVA